MTVFFLSLPLCIDLGESDVFRGNLLCHADIIVGEGAHHLCGDPDGKRARRNNGLWGDHRPGADDGFFTDLRSVQHDSADPDERSPSDTTSVDDGAVAEHDALLEDQWMKAFCNMEDAGILDIAVRADPDVVFVAADDAVEPDIRARPYLDVADHHGIVGDECRRVYFWVNAVKLQDHGHAPLISLRYCP